MCSIFNLKSNSSPGLDGISVKDLKLLAPVISTLLSSIFNGLLETGSFPKVLKSSILIPIFKKGKKDNPSNYRPISLLPVLGKLFETLINIRLKEFIESTVKFDPNQFGFLQNSNTEAALLQTLNNLNKHLDKGDYAITVFVDLQKAFDTVNHQLLLSSLDEMGIRGLPLKLLTDYLAERYVKMRIENEISEPLLLRAGVPQGSVLGPTLYFLFINNIRYIGLKGQYTIYADDTSITYHSKTCEDLTRKVNSDLRTYYSWLQGNKLQANTNKTVFMLFSQKNKPSINPNIKMNHAELSRVKSIKYLGIEIDEKLSWEFHIDQLAKNIYPLIGAFKRGPQLSKKLAKQIYNVFVVPRISQNIVIWCSNISVARLRRVNTMLARALRVLHRITWEDSNTKVFQLTETANLDATIKIAKCTLIWKMRRGRLKSNISLRTNLEVQQEATRGSSNLQSDFEVQRVTRGSDNLHITSSRTNQLLKGILNSSVLVYNDLNANIRNCKDLKTFVQKLKAFFS